MRFLLSVIVTLALIGGAVAQHSHGAVKGPNGGMVEDVAGVHAELVTSGSTITFNILDENNKSASAKGMTGSVLVVNGAERETIKLSEGGDSALKGEAKKAIAPKAAVTLMLKTPAGKSGQARFTVEK